MSFQLSAGSCEKLQSASQADSSVLESSHTIQFLSIKKVNNPSSSAPSVDRYRIIISDGVHFIQAMLATQLNQMVNDGQISRHTVAVLEKATCNTVQSKKYGCISSSTFRLTLFTG
jgi:replication factor A1